MRQTCDSLPVAALAAEIEQLRDRHPGYVIGAHWLETAYSRICAGEAEADVLRDYPPFAALTAEIERLTAEIARLREERE